VSFAVNLSSSPCWFFFYLSPFFPARPPPFRTYTSSLHQGVADPIAKRESFPTEEPIFPPPPSHPRNWPTIFFPISFQPSTDAMLAPPLSEVSILVYIWGCVGAELFLFFPQYDKEHFFLSLPVAILDLLSFFSQSPYLTVVSRDVAYSEKVTMTFYLTNGLSPLLRPEAISA